MIRPLLLAALLAGCGPKRLGDEGRYDLGDPGAGWQRVSAGGADKAWHNEALSATIYADSNCLDRYEDSALPDLITHLTFGIAQGEPLRAEELQLDGRAALRRHYAGTLDGVAITLGALTTKRDQCTYDLLYIAPPKRFDEGLPAFDAVIAGFDAPGGR